MPWSGGQAEGQVDKLKPTKRQMHGCAGFDPPGFDPPGFDPLRRRVPLAA